MTILEQILSVKSAEVDRQKRRLPEDVLRRLAERAPPPRDFRAALGGPGPRLITEVKRASPSRGVFRPDAPWSPEALAQDYASSGAAALSVLTDVNFFWGHPDALMACRDATALPVLRKDFVIDPYQIIESRWLGADAVLLLARVLSVEALQACADEAANLGMAVLLEVHADSELPKALSVPGAVIGINHRDLDTMAMDMDRARRLRSHIPSDRHVVAESGLKNPEDLRALMDVGVQSFLIGESVAGAENPGAAVRRLRGVA